jgi:hypothetical protein
MLATFLVPIPLAILSIVPVSPLHQPTRDCLLEVMTPASIEDRAVVDFYADVDTYVRLHRRLVRSMGTASMADDEGGFFGDELRVVIVAARPQARAGDFFTAAVAAVITARVDRALLRGVAAMPPRRYEPLPGEPTPAVNTELPRTAATLAWPALSVELPALPDELAYAWWGQDLLLVDVAAGLVLDVLPDALPEGAHHGILYH